MNKKENHNILALKGMDMDDMDFVKEYDLPVEVAYTKDIHEAMIDTVYKKNIEDGVMLGHTLKEAKAIAEKQRKQARAEVASFYK